MAKFFQGAKPIDGNVYDQAGTSRLAFIKKVYAYFTFSLIITGLGGYAGFQLVWEKLNTAMQGGFRANMGIFILLFVLEIVALAITWFVRKKDPINKIMLAVYSFLSGLTLGPLLAVAALVALGNGSGASAIIVQAFIITGVVFVGLTAYVFISKKDFSAWRGALFMLLIVAIVMGIFMMFVRMSSTMHLLYSAGVALLFAGFMLYDTSMIMRRYRTDEYIAGAINLQLDFVILFIHILRILIILAGRRD